MPSQLVRATLDREDVRQVIWDQDQYHEPPGELPDETRTFARLCASLTEEAEATGWYEQRMAVESDRQALAIMRDAPGEEFKHFSMDLEFLIDDEARERLTPALAARKLIDFAGPYG